MELVDCGFMMFLVWRVEVPPPRVFLRKSSDLFENKRVKFFANAKQFVTM